MNDKNAAVLINRNRQLQAEVAKLKQSVELYKVWNKSLDNLHTKEWCKRMDAEDKYKKLFDRIVAVTKAK